MSAPTCGRCQRRAHIQLRDGTWLCKKHADRVPPWARRVPPTPRKDGAR